jgi:imidazoleglycerol phosphate synthase glutamine amidotransferase subunit HisH
MQALLENSAEAPGIEGPGLFSGGSIRFETDLAVPHIGWNQIHIKQPSTIFNGLSGKERFYFVHCSRVGPRQYLLI